MQLIFRKIYLISLDNLTPIKRKETFSLCQNIEEKQAVQFEIRFLFSTYVLFEKEIWEY